MPAALSVSVLLLHNAFSFRLLLTYGTCCRDVLLLCLCSPVSEETGCCCKNSSCCTVNFEQDTRLGISMGSARSDHMELMSAPCLHHFLTEINY